MFFLFMLCAFVYNLNGRSIPSGDTRPASLIPFSILLDGTTSMDRFFETEVGGVSGLLRDKTVRSRFYYLLPHHGHLYSTYPITTRHWSRHSTRPPFG